MTTIVGFSVGVGVVLCALGILFIEPLMRAFGASDAVLPQAKDYAFWMFIAALFNLPAQRAWAWRARLWPPPSPSASRS